ncbi:MAG: adenylyl-sulfate kinase, partial [Marivirga sp.]|nr:adenylyl-sulfate kinase [Marivirga sp.]
MNHIYPIKTKVSKVQREDLLNQHATLIWFTGLSGSGKSTLAVQLEAQLHDLGFKTYLLDGDNIRAGINKDLTFTDEGRIENIRRIGEVAKLMLDAGVVVLSAFISPFKADRNQVKEIVGAENYIEIFVDAPLEVCEQRDVKGLYKKARAGEVKNFTGIDSPYEAPD